MRDPLLPQVDLETVELINDYTNDKFGPCGHALLEGNFTEMRAVHSFAMIYAAQPTWRAYAVADPELDYQAHMSIPQLRARVLGLRVRRTTMRKFWDSVSGTNSRAFPQGLRESLRDPVALELLWASAQQFQSRRGLPSAVVVFGYISDPNEPCTSLYCPPNLPYDFVLGKLQEQARQAQATSN